MNPLTSFQNECERQLTSVLKRLGLTLTDRKTEGTKETYVHAKIPQKDIEIWIYDNEAMLSAQGKSYIYEVPDYPDEDARLKAFVSAVTACINDQLPADPGSSRINLFRAGKI